MAGAKWPKAVLVLLVLTSTLSTLFSIPARPLLAATAAEGPPPPPVASSTATQSLIPIPQPSRIPVTFHVTAPAGTPSLKLNELSTFDYWGALTELALQQGTGGAWSGTVEAIPGSLLRYRYTLDGSSDTWETLPKGSHAPAAQASFDNLDDPDSEPVRKVDFRYVSIPSGVSSFTVNDTVYGFLGATGPQLTAAAVGEGTITGTITDRASGKPVPFAEVRCLDLYDITGADGAFTLRGVPAGQQRVTVLPFRSEWAYGQAETAVTAGGTARVSLTLEKPTMVPVVFRAKVPTSTSEGVVVRLASAHEILGGHWSGGSGTIESEYPSLTRVTADTWELRTSLPQGMYLQYTYTTVSDGRGVAIEGPYQGTKTYRAVVTAGGVIEDTVVAWGGLRAWEGKPVVPLTFELTAPANTPLTARCLIVLGYEGGFNPAIPMTRTGPNTWRFVTFAEPGITVYYRYLWGTVSGEEYGMSGEDMSPQSPTTYHTLTIPAGASSSSGVTQQDTVAKWRWLPKPASGMLAGGQTTSSQTASVDFWVTVPYDTPAGDTVYMVGDVPALGAMADPKAVPMIKVNPTTWKATVQLPAGQAVHYRFTRGTWASSDSGDLVKAVRPLYLGQPVYASVATWKDRPAPSVAARTGGVPFQAGVELWDWWNGTFDELTPATIDAAYKTGPQWVQLSLVWGISQVNPEPIVDPLNGSDMLPDAIKRHVDLLRDKGLHVSVRTFFYPHQARIQKELATVHGKAWWDAFLVQARKTVFTIADMAVPAGAEMILLPYIDCQAADYAYYDAVMKQLIAETRQRYPGILLTSDYYALGSNLTWYGDLDYVGTKVWWGLNAGKNPTQDQLLLAFRQKFADELEPLYNRFGKPVIGEGHRRCQSGRPHRGPGGGGAEAVGRPAGIL